MDLWEDYQSVDRTEWRNERFCQIEMWVLEESWVTCDDWVNLKLGGAEHISEEIAPDGEHANSLCTLL